jgi:glycosyltransferase involved in cell wall biosynthesis
MKLSIIIPMYNVELYIERCLISCLKQDISCEDYEIIVVNDGSPDGSLQIAERIAKDYNNITIISQPNGGLSTARNTGLSVAKGEYVWFIDSDDWIKENCLKELITTLYEKDLDALVINGIRVINEDLFKNPSREFADSILSGKEYLALTRVNCAAVITIYKKSILKGNNVFFMEGIYHEDEEFTPRAYYFIDRIGIKNYYYYYNYLNLNSITQTSNPKKGFDLIKVACSLNKFKQQIPKNLQYIYDKYISSAINQSLSNAVKMDKETLAVYLKVIVDNKYIFNSLSNLSSIVYKIEGLLFKIFPTKCVKIYNLLQKIK